MRLFQSEIIRYFAKSSKDIQIPREEAHKVYTNYTGLIIDTRGLSLQPVLFPRIYDDEGKLIISKNHIDKISLYNGGECIYVKGYEQNKTIEGRVGRFPMIVRAMRVFGKKRKGDIIISRFFLRRLFSSDIAYKNIKKGRIVIIAD